MLNFSFIFISASCVVLYVCFSAVWSIFISLFFMHLFLIFLMHAVILIAPFASLVCFSCLIGLLTFWRFFRDVEKTYLAMSKWSVQRHVSDWIPRHAHTASSVRFIARRNRQKIEFKSTKMNINIESHQKKTEINRLKLEWIYMKSGIMSK